MIKIRDSYHANSPASLSPSWFCSLFIKECEFWSFSSRVDIFYSFSTSATLILLASKLLLES